MTEMISSISLENVLWGIGSIAAIYFLVKERLATKKRNPAPKKSTAPKTH